MFRKTIWFIIYTLLFSGCIFYVLSIFSDMSLSNSEEQHLELHLENHDHSFSDITPDYRAAGEARVMEIIYNTRIQKYSDDLRSRYVNAFIPRKYEEKFPGEHKRVLDPFFMAPEILRNTDVLRVFHHESEGDARGRMKSGNIHLYGAQNIPRNEYLGVAIHEYAHLYDIYGLESGMFGDASEEFYGISWDDIYDIKDGQDYDSFVSGYAMTNKYEDFAESYTLFMIRNDIFERKAQENEVLQQKYDFFLEKSIYDPYFNEALEYEVENVGYIWDTTKIPFSAEKFLQYFREDI